MKKSNFSFIKRLAVCTYIVVLISGCSKVISNEYVSVKYIGYTWEGDFIRIGLEIDDISFLQLNNIQPLLVCYNIYSYPEPTVNIEYVIDGDSVKETYYFDYKYRDEYDSKPCKDLTLELSKVGEFTDLNIGPPTE